MLFMEEPAMELARASGRMWGASLYAYPAREAGEWLDLLAREGVRAWVAPARAGASGYLALMIHPEDAGMFARGPILSGGRPCIERWVGGEKLRLSPFSPSDFAPGAKSLQDNLERARASALSRQERQELEEAAGGAGSSRRSGRL